MKDFVTSVCNIINNDRVLMYVNFEGMNLSNDLIEIAECLAESKSLVSAHLSQQMDE